MNDQRAAVRTIAVDGAAIAVGSALILSTVAHLVGSWRPTDDVAAIAFRSRDTFGSHIPLVGMPSTAGEGVSHPGPLELWINGVFDLVLGEPVAIMLGTVAVSLAAVVAVIASGRALGGERGALVAGGGCFLLSWSLYGPMLVSPLNPHAALFPLAAALATAAVTAVSPRVWSLPLCVAFASYAAQAHVVAAMIVAVALGPPALGLLVRMRRRGGIRPELPSVGVLAVLWIGPVLDVVTNDGGNVRAIARALGGNPEVPTLGWAKAASIVAGTTVPLPVFADRAVSGADIFAGAGHVVAAAFWCSLGVLAVAAWRLRSAAPVLAWSMVFVVEVAVGSLVVTARIPADTLNGYSLYNYLASWIMSLGWWVTIVALVFWWRSRRRSSAADLVPWSAGFAVAAAVISMAVLPSPRATPAMTVTRALGPQLEDALADDRPYFVELRLDLTLYALDAGVAASLDASGYDVRVPEYFAPGFGSHRAGYPAGADRIRLVVGPEPIDEGEVIATFEPSASLLREREEAVVDLVEEILRHPEQLGASAGRIAGRRSVEEFVRGDFAGLAASRLLGESLLDRPSTKVLVDQADVAHDIVRVVRLASGGVDQD